jgi:TIR domain
MRLKRKSYTSTDRAWAEWIAWQLEAEGYQASAKAALRAAARGARASQVSTACALCRRSAQARSHRSWDGPRP